MSPDAGAAARETRQKAPRPCREVLDFQPDAVAVGESRLPVQARLAVYLILFALAFGAAWAWFSELDRVVSARGMLVTQSPAIVVQPLETSIIREIAVRPGDVVKKGQLLATLDPTFASADLGQLTERKRFLTDWIRLLDAELAGRSPPAPDASGLEPGSEELVRLTLFAKRKEEYRAKVLAGDLEIAALDEAQAANRREQARLGKLSSLAAEVEGMYRKLWSEANTSRLEYLDALKERLRIEDLHAKAIEREDQIREKLAQAKATRQAYISGFETQAATQLMEAQAQLAEVDHSLSKASRRSELVELTAVSEAIVKDMARVSAGSVIRQAETLFTLVPIGPEDGALEAEAAIPAMDIGHIRVGNPARLKLMAFPFQQHGFLDAEVRTISPDAFVEGGDTGEAGGAVYYKTRLRLLSDRPRDVAPDFRLLPGMTLEAEILVGKRRVASYILDPLIKSLHESLSEP